MDREEMRNRLPSMAFLSFPIFFSEGAVAIVLEEESLDRDPFPTTAPLRGETEDPATISGAAAV